MDLELPLLGSIMGPHYIVLHGSRSKLITITLKMETNNAIL